jgi:hypothetical protein
MSAFFRIRELEGPAAASLTLTGPAAALAGPSLDTEGKGGSTTPLGAAEALLTVTSIVRGMTEFTFSWSASNLGPGDVLAQGLDAVARPESLLGAFEALAERGRVCLVDLPGDLARRGIVRKVSGKLLRGYGVDPSSNTTRAGVDIDASVTIEWAGKGEAGKPPVAFPTAEVFAGDVGEGIDAIASAAADSDPFDPGFLAQLDDATTNVRVAGAQLRGLLRGAGPIGLLPAALARQVTASAKAFGAALAGLDDTLSDTPEIYQAAGTSMADVARGRAASGEVKGAMFSTMAVLADLFAALDARSPRTVLVRPGQSLALVAQSELGDRNRWPELAAHNGLGGQLVPEGILSIEIPGGAS